MVHGAIMNGGPTWRTVLPLAQQWRLLIVDRRGYTPNPPEPADRRADAADVSDLLDELAHVVVHSLGAVGAMPAVARRPASAPSLTLLEPPPPPAVTPTRTCRRGAS